MGRIISKNTKAFRAKELLERLERGPASFSDGECSLRAYRRWVTTWIIPEIVDLIPQLKDADYSIITEGPLCDMKK